MDALRTRLSAHAASLEGLISMVPAKFYFPPDPDELEAKFAKRTAKQPPVPKQQRKQEADARKKARLDPDQPLVPEQQQQITRAEREQEEREEAPQLRVAPFAGVDGGGSESVAGLRERLADKLQQLRAGRGGTPKARQPADGSGKPKVSKAQARRERPGRPAGKPAGDGGEAAAAAAPSAASSSARVSSGVGIAFNKLAAAATSPGKAPRKLSTAQLLAQAEEKQRLKRERLAAPDGGGEAAQMEVWQKALEKAGGIKQKDDPRLLRKTLKRTERRKKKSTREWKQRVKTVEKAKKEKQEKRTANLAGRITKNKQRSSKSGGSRAGFEGKKRSFLN